MDFNKSVKLEAQNGQLFQVLTDGSLCPLDSDTTVRGAVTLRLQSSSEATRFTITTDRDYNIVLDNVGGEWYISIEK